MGDSNSQAGISCTQPATLPANEDDTSSNTTHHSIQMPIVWGRLVSCHPDSRHVELLDDEIYLGRNHNKCKVVLQDPTVSGIHCKIFRSIDNTNNNDNNNNNVQKQSNNNTNNNNNNSTSSTTSNKLSVYITDYSTNGTFIKGNLLGKNKTTLLKNGDMVSFTSSQMNSTLSFIFQDLLLNDQDDAEISKYYIIQEILGTGNFSVVKKCIKKDTGENYAVKIIDKKKYWHLTSTRNQTESEINILKQIKHQNIISIIEIFDTERYLYIVLELATGGELFEKIKSKGKFSEPEAKIAFKQILGAVSYLHQLNISHRDLKPENILYGVSSTGEQIIKITDFGLAKIIGEKEIATTLCGTPLYVAPEIIKNCLYQQQQQLSINGDAKNNNQPLGYGKEVDIWSLGCILYILLSGRPPFDVETNNFQQISKGNFSFDHPTWKSVSDQAKDLITKLLNVDPLKRLPVKDALNHTWFSDDLYRYQTSINQSPAKTNTKLTPQHHIIHLPQIKSHNSAISLNLTPHFKKVEDNSTTSSTSTSTGNNNNNNSNNNNNINGNGNSSPDSNGKVKEKKRKETEGKPPQPQKSPQKDRQKKVKQ